MENDPEGVRIEQKSLKDEIVDVAKLQMLAHLTEEGKENFLNILSQIKDNSNERAADQSRSKGERVFYKVNAVLHDGLGRLINEGQTLESLADKAKRKWTSDKKK